ncbi:4'-phosphopantetheinyl transferase family protein [Psittacicella hinzii]|uniref:4'-phosphopantetheinyl transferase family protein n=1 Tax=Psittacicella hinzii TaxID=2028575 RepID=UPI001CA73C71|nr:4'-phosphopantetheinyl transferase superfamily protein [Psittacicella hinzii]
MFFSNGSQTSTYVFLTQVSSHLTAEQQATLEILSSAKLKYKRQLKQYSRALVKQIMLQVLNQAGLDANKLLAAVKTNEHGRPYLEMSAIDYNISNSGDWVALIIALNPAKLKQELEEDFDPLTYAHLDPRQVTTQESDKLLQSSNEEQKLTSFQVSIDIEAKHRTRPFTNIVSRYMGDNGMQAFTHPLMLDLLASEQDRFFYFWTAREAIIKALGSTISNLCSVKQYLDPQGQHSFTFADSQPSILTYYNDLPLYLSYIVPQGLPTPQVFYYQEAEKFVELSALEGWQAAPTLIAQVHPAQ